MIHKHQNIETVNCFVFIFCAGFAHLAKVCPNTAVAICRKQHSLGQHSPFNLLPETQTSGFSSCSLRRAPLHGTGQQGIATLLYTVAMSAGLLAGRKGHVGNADDLSDTEICEDDRRTVPEGGVSSPAASSERALVLLPFALGHPCTSPTSAAAAEAREHAAPQQRTSRRLQSKRASKKARTSPALLEGEEGDGS